MFFIFNNKLSTASYNALRAYHLQQACQTQNRLLTKYKIQPPINPTPRLYRRVNVDSYSTLPWVKWEAVTGVKGIPCYGLLRHVLIGLRSTQCKLERIVLKAAWRWSSESSVVNDPLEEPEGTPLYVGIRSAWGSVDGEYTFSPHSVVRLLFGYSDRYKWMNQPLAQATERLSIGTLLGGHEGRLPYRGLWGIFFDVHIWGLFFGPWGCCKLRYRSIWNFG
jgi:hypothetical protein